MHAAFQLPFSGRCSRQVYGTVTSPKECGSVLNSCLWGVALREDRKNGCEADYTFGKLVKMSLVPEKSMEMPNTHSTIHSTTNGRPIQYHHLTCAQSSLTLSLSLVGCGVWWEGGKWGREMTIFLSFPFPSSPAAAVRYVRRLLGTSQYHHSDLIWGAFFWGTIFISRPFLHLG